MGGRWKSPPLNALKRTNYHKQADGCLNYCKLRNAAAAIVNNVSIIKHTMENGGSIRFHQQKYKNGKELLLDWARSGVA